MGQHVEPRDVANLAAAAADVCVKTGQRYGTVYARLLADAGISAPVPFTEKELAEAFTEWDRRYREEPARFMSEAQHLLQETPESYGAACAPYLLALLNGDV
jgi:hypothetical protein